MSLTLLIGYTEPTYLDVLIYKLSLIICNIKSIKNELKLRKTTRLLKLSANGRYTALINCS